MIDIQLHPQGATLAIRAQPGARKSAITGIHQTALKVAVTAPPEDGHANEAILELLRNKLSVRRSEIALLSGTTHRNKVVLIAGISPDALRKRLHIILGLN